MLVGRSDRTCVAQWSCVAKGAPRADGWTTCRAVSRDNVSDQVSGVLRGEVESGNRSAASCAFLPSYIHHHPSAMMSRRRFLESLRRAELADASAAQEIAESSTPVHQSPLKQVDIPLPRCTGVGDCSNDSQHAVVSASRAGLNAVPRRRASPLSSTADNSLGTCSVNSHFTEARSTITRAEGTYAYDTDSKCGSSGSSKDGTDLSTLVAEVGKLRADMQESQKEMEEVMGTTKQRSAADLSDRRVSTHD